MRLVSINFCLCRKKQKIEAPRKIFIIEHLVRGSDCSARNQIVHVRFSGLLSSSIQEVYEAFWESCFHNWFFIMYKDCVGVYLCL